MTPEKESVSASSIILLLGGFLFIILSGVFLAVGGVSGVKTKMQPLFDAIRQQAEIQGPIEEPEGAPEYREDVNYFQEGAKKQINVKEEAPQYGGVKLDLKQQQQEEERIDSISEYPIPTLHPWEPGGRDWQDEYWDNP